MPGTRGARRCRGTWCWWAIREVAHNRSNRRRASDARAAQLAEFVGWSLAAGCQPCGRGSWVEVRVLAAELPGQTVGRVVGRMRCQHCGRVPDAAWLGDAQGRMVAVLGRGSY